MFRLASLAPSVSIARRQEQFAALLAFIAGYVDDTGVVLWKTYVSFMSGNTTQLGTALTSGKTAIIVTSATVISCFLIGIYTGTCLSLWKKARIQTLPFYFVSGVLLLYTVLSCFLKIDTIPSVALLGFSMGIMNTLVTSVGSQKVNTNFVTGTLNSLARNVAMFSMADSTADRLHYKANVLRLLVLWMGFITGAIMASLLLPLLDNLTLIIPAAMLLLSAFTIATQIQTPKFK